MSLCLQGYEQKLSNPNYEYKIKQEVEGVGKFDDVVYKFRENKCEPWTRLFIQISLKKADNLIKTGNLLTVHNKETFSLFKCLKSTKEIKDTDNCYYIIYTNANTDFEQDGWRLRPWYRKDIQEPISLIPSKVSFINVFFNQCQYTFDNEINIPIFSKYTDGKKEEWRIFLRKFLLATGQPNLENIKRVIHDKSENIIPGSEHNIRCRLIDIIDDSLFNRKEITSEQIYQLIVDIKKKIIVSQCIHNENWNLEFVNNLQLIQLLTSNENILYINSINDQFMHLKVCSALKNLMETNRDGKYEYCITDVNRIKFLPLFHFLVISINDIKELQMFQKSNKRDHQKYILIITNEQVLREIEGRYHVLEETNFRLLTEESKQYVLNEKCISFNDNITSFSNILQIGVNVLTDDLEIELNDIITKDVLHKFFYKFFFEISFNNFESKKFEYKKRQLTYFPYNFDINEDDLIEIKTDIILISGDPGTGKSVLLSNLFKKLQSTNPTSVIIRLNLNNINNTNTDYTDRDNLIKFLLNGKTEKLLYNVLQFMINNKIKIFVLLDGVDEAFPWHAENVHNLINSLMKIGTLFITTRSTQAASLENILGIHSYKMKPLSKQDQIDYLKENLQPKGSLSDLDIEKLVDTLNKISNNNNEQQDLLGIPLLLNIFTKVLNNQNVNRNNEELYNLSELFHEFVKQIFAIYLVNSVNYYEYLQNIALNLLFGKNIKNIDKNIENEIIRVGIITITNEEVAKFIHLTFAEYFVSTYIQSNFNKTEVMELLFTKVLIENDLIVLRKFINYYIKDKLNNDKTIEDYKRFINEQLPVDILYMAAYENNSEIITFILKCFEENPEIIKNMLWFASENTKLTTLAAAITKGNLISTTNLIEHCVKNKETYSEVCPAIKYLFGLDQLETTALHDAVRNNQIDIVKLLLEKIDNIINKKDNNGMTPLHHGAKEGHTKIVEVLLQHEANINEIDKNLMTPLHHAAKEGKYAVVTMLLDKIKKDGMDEKDYIDQKDKNGFTPLHHGAKEGHTEVVEVLLQYKANKNEIDDTELVEVLLELKANINETDNNNLTPLHYGAKNGYNKIVKLLLKNDAKINEKDVNGLTPLHHAAKEGKNAIVTTLLSKMKNDNMNQKDNNGFTPLHHGAKEGHKEVVRLLLNKEAEINETDNNGMTPLHHAAKEGRTEVVILLLNKKAEINKTDSNDLTPLQYAENNGHKDIVTMLNK